MVVCELERGWSLYTAEVSTKWIRNVLSACEPFGDDKLPVASMLVI